MSEQKIKLDNFPYQIIKGQVYHSKSSSRSLYPSEFLIKKPLVPLLVYLTSKGVSVTKSFDWCNCAAAIGDLEALQWLLSKKAPWNYWLFFYAAHNGHMEVLRWAKGGGVPTNVDVCVFAASHGHLEIFEWTRPNGAPCDDDVFAFAEKNGHLKCLKWLRANGAPWSVNVCANAAMDGHLECLKWLRAGGAPWDERVCAYAARDGYFEILKWAYVNGCPCNEEDEKKAQHMLLQDKDINWSLQLKERWNKNDQQCSVAELDNKCNKVVDDILPDNIKRWDKDNCKPFRLMVDQVVNECHNVTGDLLPTCLYNLVVNYL